MIVAKSEAAVTRPRRHAFPVSPGRPELKLQKKVHPLLQRFKDDAPAVAEAESPSWLWEPQLEYLKEERYDPILPIQLRKMPIKPKRIRILSHEVAIERGDTWQEGASRKGRKLWNKMMPPGRRDQERESVKLHEWKKRKRAERIRRLKIQSAKLMKQKRTS